MGKASRRPKGGRKVRRRRWPVIAGWSGGALALVLAGFLLFHGSGSGAGSSPIPAPSVAAGVLARGQPPPNFTATTFDGKSLTLSSLRGKPVLVNFFASWCTQCAHELPLMEQAYQAHRSSGFTIVAVNSLENGDGVAFYHSFGLTFPAVHDPGNPGAIASAYNVIAGLPVSVFVAKDGTVDLIEQGALTSDLIEAEIQKLS